MSNGQPLLSPTEPNNSIHCSVIIPTIGRESLTRAVESVIAQDVPGCEIIVVNDSGAPLQVPLPAFDPPVLVISTNREKVGAVRNAGAAVARGKYLKFLDDDDYLLPDGLKTLLDIAESGGHKWVVGSAVLTDSGGAIQDHLAIRIRGNALGELFAGSAVQMSYTLVERDGFFHSGGFDPDLRYSEDREFAWRMAIKYDPTSTLTEVACVRISGSPRSAFDFLNVEGDNKLLRERMFNTRGIYRRLDQSFTKNPWLRGLAARQGLASMVDNFKQGHVLTAARRAAWFVYTTRWFVIDHRFMKGLRRQEYRMFV